jgi:branched-chain amino acid transport system substrate-binding protein
MKFKLAALAASLLLAIAGAASAQTQGVSKTEIVIGTIQDLSGPLASYGKQDRNGMQMRVDEINEQGGIQGRKLRLIVEDSGYDPKRGVLAAQKLVQKDKVFVMAGTLGTSVSLATMPLVFEHNVIHLFPVTAARQMYEPLGKLKYSFAATYYDQMRSGIKFLSRAKADRKWCIIYQDDDFGTEVLQGAEAGLKEQGKALIEKTSYKRGATDFSSQVAKMKSSGCDTVVLGTIIRETVGTVQEARKTGWNPEFIGSSAAYTDLIPKLGGAAMNGVHATHTVQHPYLDDASKNVRDWGAKYKAKFGEDPTVFSIYGYSIIDTFGKVADKAGPDLSADKFVATLDGSSFPRDMFGADAWSFSKTKHLASNKSRISQIVNGKWTTQTDYVEP